MDVRMCGGELSGGFSKNMRGQEVAPNQCYIRSCVSAGTWGMSTCVTVWSSFQFSCVARYQFQTDTPVICIFLLFTRKCFRLWSIHLKRWPHNHSSSSPHRTAMLTFIRNARSPSSCRPVWHRSNGHCLRFARISQPTILFNPQTIYKFRIKAVSSVIKTV